jgi:DNA-directed RNA polymerase alpha subunit
MEKVDKVVFEISCNKDVRRAIKVLEAFIVREGNEAKTLRAAGMNTRAINCLADLDIRTLGDLLERKRKDVAAITYMGPDTMEHIDKILIENGLFWEEEDLG